MLWECSSGLEGFQEHREDHTDQYQVAEFVPSWFRKTPERPTVIEFQGARVPSQFLSVFCDLPSHETFVGVYLDISKP